MFLATHNDYRWVELDGITLRAKHLYTGRVIERSIGDIAGLRTIVYEVRTHAIVITEHLLGRVRGIEVRFRDGLTPLRINRADPAMTNAHELIEAIVYRITEFGEVDAEVVEFAGHPLVRSIHWKGESSSPASMKNTRVILAVLTALALMAGTFLAFSGEHEHERYSIGSLPPQVISVRSLIEHGPGSNRHVTLTDFRPGGYTAEQNASRWTTVWVPLFPKDEPSGDGEQIRLVLSSEKIPDRTALSKLTAQGTVTGISARRPDSSWGTTLGPNLLKSNPGCQLSSAWSVEEMRKPPSKALIDGLLAGSYACFLGVILLSCFLFRG